MSNETIGEQQERILSEATFQAEMVKSFVKGMAEQVGLTVLGSTCKDCKQWTGEIPHFLDTDKRLCKVLSNENTNIIHINSYEPAEIYTPPDFACNQWESKA